MKFIHFKFFIIFLCFGSIIYYYYYNYLAKPEIIFLQYDSIDYKIKKEIIKKNIDENIIYKSRKQKNFDETDFKILNNDIDQNNLVNLKYKNAFVEANTKEINLQHESNRFIDQTSHYKKYYIEIGTFISIEDADKVLKEIQNNNLKSLAKINFSYKFVNSNNRTYAKLIICNLFIAD